MSFCRRKADYFAISNSNKDSLKNIVEENPKNQNKLKENNIKEQVIATKHNESTQNESTTSQEESEPSQEESDSESKHLGALKKFTGVGTAKFTEKAAVSVTKNNNSKVATADESDSDSDYEYFKVQKEIESNKTEQKPEEEEVQAPKTNMFESALKTAIVEDELVLPATVNQIFVVIPMKLRLVSLCSQIVQHCILNKKGGKMIVFMATLEMVDYFSELIETVLTGKDVKGKKRKDNNKKKNSKAKTNDDEDESDSGSEFEMDFNTPGEGGLVPVDLDVFSLHGSMPHEQRMEVFKQFRLAKRGLLICTDVAARGLDVPRVDLVLQFCAPASATDYVHRVGRTGRGAQVGAAILFLLPSEGEFVRHLEQKRIRLRQSDESTVLEALRTVAPGAPTMQRAAIAVQAWLEHIAHSSKEWLARASRAYTSWVRFYSGYPRDVRQWLDARQLHLGHAAKAFALRETPAALAKRARSDPKLKKEKPSNRLSVKEDEEKRRPGFANMKSKIFGNRLVNKQSSMHTASEYDSGLPPLNTFNNKKA
ncbi:probable ATP-dependent RNA helicase CG8611 [Leptidea sinapis]|uniref:probable ATP-dependent RNA helicase CG8611 n=1 Tax=Leptidea sinapis TaxID=189913 RepID=UPI0021C34372|nr:probable ATP-dependent RNA helicase CG8611 [Leptidea sinapis]